MDIGEPQKQSGLGITSFVLSIISGLGAGGSVILAGVMEASTPGGLDQQSPEAIAVGLAIIGSVLLAALALIFGLIGLAQKDRKKIFAILGTVFSGLIVVGVVLLIIVGLGMNQ